MLDDASFLQADLAQGGLPPEAPLAMPRQVLERPRRPRRRWLRLFVLLAR